MPWTVEDVDSHMEGLTDEQKAKWVEVANAALDACTADGGEDCDAKAIATANAAVKEEEKPEPEAATEEAVQEAVTIKAQAQGLIKATDGLLGEKTLPQVIRAAIQSLRAALKKTWADLAGEADGDETDDKATEDTPAEEAALDVEFVPLVEKSVRPDSTIPVKLIQPGWGSSGYYSAEVLQRDGAKAFPAKTHMFWDHPTSKEEAERPERSLRDLAAELVTDAKYLDDGKYGPGLYADAKVFSQFQNAVDELAPHIGVSIRALGRAKPGEAEGRKGPVIQEIAMGRSVDFVTVPGAGGQVLELFESARTGTQPATSQQEVKTVTEEEAKRLKEANEALTAKVAELEEALASAHKTQEATNAQLVEAGRVRGMGGSTPTDGAALLEAFKRAGLDEKLAAIAAKGR